MRSTDTRERIVHGSEGVFADRGPGQVTVEDLIRAARVSRRTFYQYFRSKEDVLAAVYDHRMDELVAALAAALAAATDPVDKVIGAVDAWLELQLAGGTPLVALQSEAVRAESLLHPRREATLDAIARTLSDAVKETLGAEVDLLVYRGLVMGIEGLLLHLAQEGRLGAERARLRRVAAALVLGTLANARELPAPPR